MKRRINRIDRSSNEWLRIDFSVVQETINFARLTLLIYVIDLRYK